MEPLSPAMAIMAQTDNSESFFEGANSTNDPIIDLSNRLITSLGRQIVLNDKDLRPETIEMLKQTEIDLKSFAKDYLFLLGPHSVKQSLYDTFFVYNKVGLSHISIIISSNPNKNYADFVAEYCDDRDMPFLAGAILLEELRTHYGFCYYVPTESGMARKRWEPAPAACPHFQISIIRNAGMQSAKITGLSDSQMKVLLKTVNCDPKVLACKLGIPTKRYKELFRLCAEPDVSPVSLDVSLPPVVKKASIAVGRGDAAIIEQTNAAAEAPTKKKQHLCDEAVINAYREANYINSVAADNCGLTTAWFTRRINKLKKQGKIPADQL